MQMFSQASSFATRGQIHCDAKDIGYHSKVEHQHHAEPVTSVQPYPRQQPADLLGQDDHMQGLV
jgi:hypothetical protein